MPCTFAFRGHQDQCFGLKLLFQPQAFARLSAQQQRSLHTGRGMYRHGPYWWRQVLEMAGLPYRQQAPGLWSVTLTPQLLKRVLPLFTLTTAVAGRRLRFDSYCALHLDGGAAELQVYERDILQGREPPPDFSAGGRSRARQRQGHDPLHVDADPVKAQASGSFRIRNGDLIGRLGYLVGPYQWSTPQPSGLTRLEQQLGLRTVPSRKVLRFQPPHDAMAMPDGTASASTVLRNTALWAGGDMSRLVTLLHALGEEKTPQLWGRRRRQMLERAVAVPPMWYAQHLAHFARELPEYAGGDQLTRRVHSTAPWYASVLLRQLQHTLQLAILHAAPWSGIYADTGDSHRRVLQLPSAVMPEWRPPRTVLVLGDVHGSFHALLRNLLHMRQQGYLDAEFRLHPAVLLVCLGDYVDYGPYGVEVLWTLLWLQLLNRRQVVLLGGNHEDVGQNQVSGGMPDNFALELRVRFGDAWERMAPLLERFYASLPRALECRVGDYILHFSHGCATPTLAAMKRGPVSSDLGEQIAWADIHQKPQQEHSSRGGNVQVYGLKTLAPLLGCRS